MNLETSNLVHWLTTASPTLPIKIFPERGVVRVSWPVLEFYTPCKISVTANARDFKFCTRVGHAKCSLVMSECSLSGRGQGHVSNFYIVDLFRHSKSSVDRWYTQLDRRRFVNDTYKTVKATRTRHGWVHMFTTHWPTLTLQLHNIGMFRTCHTALLRGNWQDFNWRDALCGPLVTAELHHINCDRRLW